MTNPILAEVVRSGFVESTHRGRLVVLDASGAVRAEFGDVRAPMFPRSANKPLQAVSMLRSGLLLDGAELALAAGSHHGEPVHLSTVRKVLADAGLDESALGCPPALPSAEAELASWVAAGKEPAPIAMVCSGKHAAMLATCVANNWDTANYLDIAHPLQQSLAQTIAEFTGESIELTGIDGCGAPIYGVSLLGLARGYFRLNGARQGAAEHLVAAAMRTHPIMVQGNSAGDSRAMRAAPGLVCKHGAEGVLAAALPDGGSVAMKIDDGSLRAAYVLLNAVVGGAELEEVATAPVLGGVSVVGGIRSSDIVANLR